ncbi:MAG: sulfurtransferase [Candidatus Cloacimonadota bacterium]|nr:MAG: sulfurtransferase [Candidatus Cloacimonadota bacterium]
MSNNYDVIVIGAGSVGVPTALLLSQKKLRVLVIDKNSSPGQGQNKKAIGGIRATHSDKGKILTSLRSIEFFSTWQDKYGDDIDWMSNGYSFPAYNEQDEKMLKDLLEIQQSFGLNIKWISAEEYQKLVPGINPDGLRGSTYSPEDGSASPFKAINAFYFKSIDFGCEYKFDEQVISIGIEHNKVKSVSTDKGKYFCDYIVNAGGNNAKDIGLMIGIDIPVKPDSHEAAITERVKPFFKPMVVDMRPATGSKNYYFYQSKRGQIVFCITPEPPFYGTDSRSTSVFLPQVAKRMIELFPRLKNIKVRRTWRGQYPMSPDGFPIVGELKEVKGFINAVGMCGQGFMLGPGIGNLITRIITNNLTKDDNDILYNFSLYRDFSGTEKFK